jgi:tetratricopeptide (TPR) repeat protein
MEYIRRKKIYAAALELTSGRNIYDIALDYGYETSTGFYKAFQSVFGCSPSDYKNNILRSSIMDTKNIKSAEQLTKEIELDINNAELYIQRGKSYFQTHQLDQAIEDYNKALELNIKNKAEIYRELGHSYLHMGQFDKVIESYTKAIELEPNAADYMQLGQAYKNKQEYEKALSEFNKAIEIEPKSPSWVYCCRGVCYYKLGETDKAEADFYRVIETEDKDNKNALAMAYMHRGQSYHHELRQIYKALEDYNKALELDPKVEWAYNNRAAVYTELKQYDKALENYNEALEINPQAEWVYHSRFHLHQELNQYDKAIEGLNKMIELNPKNSWQYIQRGVLYEKLGESEKAEQDYAKVAELDPENTQLYWNRFQAYEEQNQLEKALEDIDKAIELNPNDWFLYARRGTIYEKLANGEKAMENFIKLQEFDLEESAGNRRGVFKAWLYDSRAKSYMFVGNYDKAIEDIGRAIEFTSEEWKSIIYIRRANCREILGQHNEAEKDYAKAMEFKPEWGYNDLAWRFILVKQYDKAIKMLEKVTAEIPASRLSPLEARINDCILTKEYKKVIEYATEALKDELSDDRRVLLYRKRGWAYNKIAEHEKAEADLLNALNDNAEQWWRHATECVHDKQYDKAKKFCEKAIEIDPEHEKAHDLLDDLKAIA